MTPLCLWLCMLLVMALGRAERGEEPVRHERTRYLTLGTRYVVGENGAGSSPSRYPVGRHPFQVPDHIARAPTEPRQLFSWDAPAPLVVMSSPSTPVHNSPTNPSWRARGYKRVKAGGSRRRHHKSKSVSFRKSYVYKERPSKEEREAAERQRQSKKIVYVVSRRGKEGKRKKAFAGRVGWRKDGRSRAGHGRRANDVDYFPKGLIVDGMEELRKSWRTERMTTTTTERPAPSGACQSGGGCEQVCTEDNGRVVCSCYSGYTVINETKCVDVDECRINNGGCEWGCVNTLGSRRCLCPDGYRLSPEEDKCEDVNECLLRNGHGPCQDTCVNTRGGYYCTCDGIHGTVLSRNNHTCEEVNDCNSGGAGCSHSCVSTFGRSFCTCPDGFELGEDWKTCHDIDECYELQDQGIRCEFGCINTIGSYYCEMENSLDGLRG